MPKVEDMERVVLQTHLARRALCILSTSTKKGVQAATKWFLHLGLLNQFSLAREMDQEAKEVHQENYQENQDLGQEDQHQGMGERES